MELDDELPPPHPRGPFPPGVGPEAGAILETWAVAEVLKRYWHSGRRAPVFFYRDKDKKEIDLLLHQDGTLYPIEIKKTAQPGREAVRQLPVLEGLAASGYRTGPGALVCLAPAGRTAMPGSTS